MILRLLIPHFCYSRISLSLLRVQSMHYQCNPLHKLAQNPIWHEVAKLPQPMSSDCQQEMRDDQDLPSQTAKPGPYSAIAAFVSPNSHTQPISTQSESNYRTPKSPPMCTLMFELIDPLRHIHMFESTADPHVSCTTTLAHSSHETTTNPKTGKCLLQFLHGLL